MGGEGSGRRPDVIKMAETQRQDFIKFTGGESQIEIPNLSGVQKEALKTGTAVMQEGDSHTLLSNIGTNTHAAIDTHLANNNIHVPSMTAGSVAFHNGTILSQDNSNLFWDDTNNRLGIGTVSPGNKLDVIGGGIYTDNYVNAVAGVRGGNIKIGPYFGQGQAYEIFNTDDGKIVFFGSTAGNVGIGTIIPATLLHLSGSSQFTMDNSGSFSMANNATPGAVALALGRISGSMFVSGGAFFYKGDQGTVTLLAAR